MKNKDYTDLRNKTIFDFCTDEDVLDDLVGITDKEEYLHSLSYSGVSRWLNLLYFAEYSGNKELEEAVRDEFKDEINDMFNE